MSLSHAFYDGEVEDFCFSLPQRAVWLDQAINPETVKYHCGYWIDVRGGLDISRFEAALSHLVSSFDGLRLVLNGTHPDATQRIVSDLRVPLLHHDLTQSNDPDGDAEKFARNILDLPFHVRSGAPLWQHWLLHLPENRYIWFWSGYHLVVDGWSVSILFDALLRTYDALGTGEAPDLQAPSYKEKVDDDLAYMASPEYTADLAFWRSRASCLAPPLSFPRRETDATSRKVTGKYPTDVFRKLKQASRREGVSSQSMLVTLLLLTLMRDYGQDALCLSIARHGRGSNSQKKIYGMCSLANLVSAHLEAEDTFRSLVRKVDADIDASLPHQRFPITEVNRLALLAQPGRSDLFNVSFSLLMIDKARQFNGHQAEPLILQRGNLQSPLEVQVYDRVGECMLIDFLYEPFAMTDDRAQALLEAYASAIANVDEILAVDRPLLERTAISAPERDLVLNVWNRTERAIPDWTFVDLFEDRARSTPSAIALEFEEEVLDYGTLNRLANRAAHALIRHGVGTDEVVGLCMSKCPAFIISALAVMKAGGAYLPLDPGYPVDRLGYMVQDSGLRLVIADSTGSDVLGHQISCLSADDLISAGSFDANPRDQDRLRPLTPRDLAYVIYTSGSTGKPKGVAIEHQGVVNLALDLTERIQIGPDSKILQFASINFDASVVDIVMAFAGGGSLVLGTKDTLRPGAPLVRTINRHGATHLCLPPSVLAVLPEDELPSVRSVMAAGEACSGALAARWSKCRRFYNGYGPTEATVCATVSGPVDGVTAPTIGTPLFNVLAYILDDKLEPVAVSDVGELWIGGVGVARGYLNRPDLTAQRFLDNPFGPGRIYRTGDLARWNRMGEIEFIGRADNQVKIRGFRIEPDEIAERIKEVPGISDAVVVPLPDPVGGTRLVAYAVPYRAAQATAVSSDDIIATWKETYEVAQAEIAKSDEDPLFDTTGWFSSFDGSKLPKEQMDAWASDTVTRIRALQPRRLLEIGCGRGILLFRIAPFCERYAGIDLSDESIAHVRRQIALNAPRFSNADVRQGRADDLSTFDGEQFDTVVMNSMVQYFPDPDYLLQVLDGAMAKLAPGGTLFIGDVRDLRTLRAFHTWIQLSKMSDNDTADALARRVEAAMREDNELALDPAFFMALQQRFPQIRSVALNLQSHNHPNEMSKFRYSAVIRT